MDNYRKIPRISNSDLTEFKYKLFNIERRIPLKAFAFGSAFHQLLLEPHKGIKDLSPGVDFELVERLIQAVKASRLCRWFLQFAGKEQIHLFTDPDTGLHCKSKLDICYRQSTILDFKTTSARSEEEFLRHAWNFDYDRQAAFYLDSIAAKRFLFVAVQKRSPFKVFTLDTALVPGFVDYGRKKYKALLRSWKKLQPHYLQPDVQPNRLAA